MVAPMIIAAGIMAGAQVVSGLMQHYQSEKARGANEKRLKEIEALFNKIVPPELDISIFDDPRVAQEIPPPMLNFGAITPQEYASVGQYVPEMAEFVRETNPELLNATQNASQGRQAQMEALERYKGIASGGFDPALHQKLQMASDKASGDAQSRQQSILQDANRRGMLGSGFEMASQMGGAADSMRRSAMEGQMAAAESYKNQLNALDQSASLGGNIRASEMQEQGRNADIINSFNQRTSKNYQDWLQGRADASNQANLRNLNTNQSIADRNTGLANEFSVGNQQRWNAGVQQDFNNKRTSRDDLLDIAAKKRAVQQQQYMNAMNQANGKAGIQQSWIDNTNQNTRDKNQAVQGVGNAVSNAAMVYGYMSPDGSTADAPKPKQQYPQGGYNTDSQLYGDPNNPYSPKKYQTPNGGYYG